MKSVLLVGPDSRQGTYTNPPGGLLYLHGMLRANGIPVDWVDENQNDTIDVTTHDIIGISMMTSNRHRALAIAQQARDAGKFVIVGGPHPTLMPAHLLNHYSQIDVCVMGDGERPLLALATGQDYANIPGITWRENGVVKSTPREPDYELDSLPFASWDTVDFSRYKGGARVQFSRGCAWGNCLFCSISVQWPGQRWRKAESFVREMEWLRSLGQHGFAWYDDCLTGDMDRSVEVFQLMIDRQLNMEWVATTRPTLVTKELLQLAKQAGCVEMTFGIETVHPELLKIYTKGQTEAHCTRAIRWCQEIGLRCTALMVYNGIRRAEFDPISHRWIAEMKVAEGSANELEIFPETPLYRAMVDHGFMDDSIWLTNIPFPLYNGELDHLTPSQWSKYHT